MRRAEARIAEAEPPGPACSGAAAGVGAAVAGAVVELAGVVGAFAALATLTTLAADVLVELAQELGILVGGEGAVAPRTRTAGGASAPRALLAHEQPGERSHPGDQHDQHDPCPFRHTSDLVVLGLHTVGECEDGQGDREDC